MAKRVAAVFIGVLFLAGGIAGQPTPDQRVALLLVVFGAAAGTLVAWVIQRRKNEPLAIREVLLGSVIGASALMVFLAVVFGGDWLMALAAGLGGGVMAGLLLALINMGLRGTLSSEADREEGDGP